MSKAIKAYAGIGARKTPVPIQGMMHHIAGMLENEGFILRSGSAEGADSAFEAGVHDPFCKEIYTPHSKGDHLDWDNALATVARYHPAPAALSTYVYRLMARNAFQILGPDLLHPSKFVICWTPDAAQNSTSMTTGGTGQAIRIANDHGIPVFNLADRTSYERLSAWIDAA
jgi:hypothetical protein